MMVNGVLIVLNVKERYYGAGVSPGETNPRSRCANRSTRRCGAAHSA